MIIPIAYSCYPIVHFPVRHLDPQSAFSTWGEFFPLQIDTDHGKESGLDFMIRHFEEGQRRAIEQGMATIGLPHNWNVGLAIEDESFEFRFNIAQNWCFYRAKIEAHLVDGSYEIIQGKFAGTQTLPAIDLSCPESSGDWIEIQRAEVETKASHSTFVFAWGDVKRILTEVVSLKSISPPGKAGS